MHVGKRGQVSESTFIYVIVLVIVGVILTIGYNLVSSSKDKIDKADLILLKNQITFDIENIGKDYRTFIKKSYSLPALAELCLVDLNQKNKILESELANYYPLMRDSIDSDIRKNAFVISDSVFESYFVGEIELNHYPHFKCFKPENNKIEMGIEGLGNKALILSEFVASVDLNPEEEIELVSTDGVIKLIIPKGTTAAIDSRPVNRISIEIVETPATLDAEQKASDIHNFKPSGAVFRNKIELIRKYDSSVVTGCPESLVWYQRHEDGSLKAEIPSKEINCEAHEVTFEIDSFSFGYIGTPPCGNNICETGENHNNCPQDCAECELINAYWKQEEAVEDEQVALVVIGENCNNKQVTFVVKEDDVLGDDSVEANPEQAAFIGNKATTLWTAELDKVGFLNKYPEYYFVARVGDPEIESNNKLEVRSSKACELTNALWEKTEAVEGEEVSLTVNGENCENKQITFIVEEADIIGDDEVSINPEQTTFIENEARSTWTAELEDVGFINKYPEYVFTAQVDDEEIISNNKLEVRPVEEEVVDTPVSEEVVTEEVVERQLEGEFDGYIIKLKQEPLVVQNQELETEAEENEGGLLAATANFVMPKCSEFATPNNLDELKECKREEIADEHTDFIEKALEELDKEEVSNEITGNVVSEQNSDELVVLNEYEKVFNGLVLDISDEEAENLKQLDEVEEVYPNLIVNISLSDSVPLINADDVWLLDKDGNNCAETGEECLTGKDITIGIIDTGVDYTHADLGGSEIEDRDFEMITDQPLQLSFPTTDQQIAMDGNRIVYYSGNNIYIHSFETLDTNIINAFSDDLQIVRLAFRNDRLVYFASTSDLVTSLYYYNANTGVHQQILPDYNHLNIGTLFIYENKIIYSMAYLEEEELYSNIYIYDIDTEEITSIAENYDGIYMPSVSDEGMIAYSVSSGHCYDKIMLYNLNTGDEEEITPPDVGPVLDFEGKEILYIDCSKTNFDNQWRHYHIYDINTEESIPLFYDVDAVGESDIDTLNSLGVRSRINKGAIANDVIYFSKDVNANRIIAYDQNLDRYVQINLLKSSGTIDAENNKVCFIADDKEIYCHDYDTEEAYELPETFFNSKVIDGYDFVNDDADPMDDHGHGTHVAATAAGNGILKGVAPDANIVAYKVLNSKGRGSFENIIDAIERSVDPNQDGDFSDHLDILSLSLGANCGGRYSEFCGPDDPSSQAIDNAVSNGAIAIVAAGNDGPEEKSIGSPGTARKAVTVGATFKRDNDVYQHQQGDIDDLVYFSSRGPVSWGEQIILKPDVVAPGVNICAAQWDNAFWWKDTNCNNDNNHVAISGTSMATPIVSGAAALLKQANPNWTPAQIKSALRNSGIDIEELPIYQGYGRIDIVNALDIESPLVVEIITNGLVSGNTQIIGSVLGNNLQNYRLEYGTGMDPSSWTQLSEGTAQVNEDSLGTLNTDSISDGKYTLRVIATDSQGKTYEDRTIVKINNDPSFVTLGSVDSFFHFWSPFVVGDVTVDGNKEIIATESIMNNFAENPKLWVWDKDDNILNGWPKEIDYWDFLFGRIVIAAPALGDIDNDGINEVIHIGGKMVYAYNADGSSVEGFPIDIDPTGEYISNHGAEFPHFSVGDVDGDGNLEIISILRRAPGALYGDNSSKSVQGILYIFNSNGEIQTTKILNGIANSAPALADINDDGQIEIVVSIGDKVEVVDNEGNSLPGWPQSPTGKLIVKSPVLGDVNGDGQLEIIIIDYFSNTVILNNDGTTKEIVPYPLQKGFNDFQDISLIDSDNDDNVEILVRGKMGMFILDGNGSILAETDVSSTPPSFSAVGDVDADNEKEIIVWDNDFLYILDTDLQIKQVRLIDTFSRIGGVQLTDFDNNNMVDIVGIAEDGSVFVWENIADYNENSLDWPMFMHDPQHTGLYDKPISTEEAICTDSDGGLNYYVKGTASGINSIGIFEEKIDSCNEGQLYEAFCDNNVVLRNEILCENGCQDGACLMLDMCSVIEEEEEESEEDLPPLPPPPPPPSSLALFVNPPQDQESNKLSFYFDDSLGIDTQGLSTQMKNVVDYDKNSITMEFEGRNAQAFMLTKSGSGDLTHSTFDGYIVELKEKPLLEQIEELESESEENEDKLLVTATNFMMPKCSEFATPDNLGELKECRREELSDEHSDFIKKALKELDKKEVSNEITGNAVSEPNSDELVVTNEFENVFNGIAIKDISSEEAKEIEKIKGVKKVSPNFEVKLNLMDSVPIIKADRLWDQGLTGEGLTIGIIDTGVDYTHADLGSCNDVITLNGNVEDYPLDSPHPYTNNYDNTWTITMPGFEKIAVHFSKIDVESFFDNVEIIDAEDNVVQTLTGYHNDVWSASVDGDTIKIRLTTDYSVTDWRFAIDSVLNGEVSFDWETCDKVIGGYDFVSNDENPMDDNGHGTHVAATAAGNGVLKGVAPDADIVAYKVLNSRGSGNFDGILAAIERSIDPNQDGNFSDHLDIISLSLGANCGSYSEFCGPDDSLSQAIDTAVDAGVVAVISAGNSGPREGTIGSPGTARKAITVGATYKKDYEGEYFDDTNPRENQITSFSSRGPVEWPDGYLIKPDVVAPGAFICAARFDSIFPEGQHPYYYPCLDEEHVQLAGTSMATPIVSGAAALLKQANPDWTPEQIKSALSLSARDLGLDVNEQGTGFIDVEGANDIGISVIPNIVSFGKIIDTLPPPQTITIINNKDEPVNLFLAEDCSVGELSTNNIVIEPGSSEDVLFSLIDIPQKEGAVTGNIQIFDGINTYLVPYGFKVTSELTVFVNSDKEIPSFDFSITNDELSFIETQFSSFDSNDDGSHTIDLLSGMYTVYAAGDTRDFGSDGYLLMKNVDVPPRTRLSLTLDTDDARPFTIKAEALDGTGLLLYEWQKAFNVYNDKGCFLSYDFTDPTYGDKTVYVSNKPENNFDVDVFFKYDGIPSIIESESSGGSSSGFSWRPCD